MSKACRPRRRCDLDIDREKAAAFGVTFEEINNTISTNLGSNYINDFPNRGRMQRVVVQADRGARMQADEILSYRVRNSAGQLVPFSSFATVTWRCRADADRRLQLLSVGAHVRFGEARLYLGRRHPGDGEARGATAARFRLRMDRTIVAGEAIRLAGAVPARALGAAGVPRAGGALYEAGPYRSRCC